MNSQEESKFQRLLNGKFSGSVSRTFEALKSQLEKKNKEEMEGVEGVKSTKENITRGILLRAFIKGCRILKDKRSVGTSVSESENLYNFKNENGRERKNWVGGNGRVGGDLGLKPSGPFRDEGGLPAKRFPLPSFLSVKRNLLSSKNSPLNIKIIKSKHLRILELDLQGIYSRSQIARMIGCSEPTITNVLNYPPIVEFKMRALSNMEGEYSSLLKPAVAAVRDSLQPGQSIELRQDTAFKYLKTQGKGISQPISIHKHEHGHIHTGEGGSDTAVLTELSDVKRALLKRLGHDPKKIIEAQFKKVSESQKQAGD